MPRLAPSIVQRGPERGIQIPDAFYMILVDTDGEWQDRPTVRILAHRFPQTTPRDADYTDRTLYGASVNDIEHATNLDFFPLFAALFATWEDREDENPDAHRGDD